MVFLIQTIGNLLSRDPKGQCFPTTTGVLVGAAASNVFLTFSGTSMKRLKNLSEITASRSNVELAVRNARRNRNKKNALVRDMKRFMADYENNVKEVMGILSTGDWHIAGYKSFQRKEHGKVRNIDWNPSFRDNVIQHALFNTVGKALVGTFIADTFSGIEGRGMHHGMTRVFDRIQTYRGRPLYIYKADIHHYYESVDNGLLKQMIARKIKDGVILKLLCALIDSHPNGLPIGNYLSQLLANFYLNETDHWAVSDGYDYFRYCDDLVVLSDSKERLHSFHDELQSRLKRMGLHVKPSFQIFPIERTNGLDFMGFSMTRDSVRLRKRIERNFRRSASAFVANPCEHTMQSIMSYYGWTKWLTSGETLWNNVLGELEETA